MKRDGRVTKSKVVPIRGTRTSGNDDRPGAAVKASRSQESNRCRRAAGFFAAIIIAVGGWLAYARAGYLSGVLAYAGTAGPDALSAAFSICGENRRVNCVVDGDTFWFEDEKIRIADIDTPELSPPRCEAERVRGEAAKSRLLALLNAGKFSLAAGFRDEDKYGRKLRTVTRARKSLGEVLVQEGLAQSWDGARHGWCQGQ